MNVRNATSTIWRNTFSSIFYGWCKIVNTSRRTICYGDRFSHAILWEFAKLCVNIVTCAIFSISLKAAFSLLNLNERINQFYVKKIAFVKEGIVSALCLWFFFLLFIALKKFILNFWMIYFTLFKKYIITKFMMKIKMVLYERKWYSF